MKCDKVGVGKNFFFCCHLNREIHRSEQADHMPLHAFRMHIPRRPTSFPILPNPSMPRFFLKSSIPSPYSFFGHLPCRISIELTCKKRDTASICAMASSATDTDAAAGVFKTFMPLLSAKGTSILSSPTPPRPITLSFFPASITSFVTFVADLTIMQS